MSNQEKLDELTYNRDELIKEIMRPKYSYIEITDKDKQANTLYHSKVVPGFIFPEDFHCDLALKYKSDIEKNEFFKDLEYMPKGSLLHQHIVDCIDIKWLSEEVMKKENLKYIFMRKFRDMYDILVYTTAPKETDKPFKDIIEAYLKEHEGKTSYDYFYPKLTMLPEEVEKIKTNDIR